MPIAVAGQVGNNSFSEVAVVSVANTNLDGTTGTYASLKAAGQRGSVVNSVEIKARVTTTAGMIRLFRSDGVNGYLIAEIPVTAAVPSGTVQAFSTVWTPSTLGGSFGAAGQLTLNVGETLKATTNNSESFIVTTNGYDL